jgi:hypothetical protein
VRPGRLVVLARFTRASERFGPRGYGLSVRPRAGTLAALSLAIALVGCGGSTRTSAPQEPALPRAVAKDLASKSDEIADALDSGDVCGAASLADRLKDAVDAAVSSGRVPPVFQKELEQASTDLQNEVNCEEQKQDDKEKGKKKGHDEDETTTLGTTLSTTTEESN